MGIRAIFTAFFVAVVSNVLAIQMGVGIYDMTGELKYSSTASQYLVYLWTKSFV